MQLAKLKAHRKALRLTQSELAEKMNVTRRSIIRWENGQTKPSMRKLQMLAEVMGCDLEDFEDDEAGTTSATPTGSGGFGFGRLVI